LLSQVKDYGHWIPQESTGNSRKWKQYSDQKFVGFFPVDSSQFPVLSDRNRAEIIEQSSYSGKLQIPESLAPPN
jgi:hypothetical protein